MLRLKQIVKTYKVADLEVNALKGIDLSFRKNEFVSILGPSGCGKTTTLNIIGGLDKYTSGDLIINGVSTKNFKDRDWDVYRNHRIGFIFQAYNLIPHQTILGNVELALTISGISKKEREERAKKALDKVGLAGQYKKHPNQLSGGQCQRVAIARALVNEPDILLADEPTGALDTVTSVQIMELIKEISAEKLVIMVTHNPELAEKYSTRIVNLLDGEVLNDSNPFSEEEEIKECEELKKEEAKLLETNDVATTEKKAKEKAKMSLWTAIRLSSQNLYSKIKRTVLVALAGSIGIVGVSVVLSISAGIKNYIKTMQDDMLSGYPITITETAFDMSALSNMMSTGEKIKTIKNVNEVGVEYAVNQLVERMGKVDNSMKTNKITAEYINYINAMPEEYRACIEYGYGIDFSHSIFSDFKALNTTSSQMTSITAIKDNYTNVLANVDGFSQYSSYVSSLVETFSQAPDNKDYILNQYNVLEGKVATEANEVMIVVNSNKELMDLVLAEIGVFDQEEFIKVAQEAVKNPESTHERTSYTYSELMNHKFKFYANDLLFYKTSKDKLIYGDTSIYTYNYNEKAVLDYASKNNITIDNTNSLELKVVGILQAKDGVNYGSLSSGFYYTKALVDYSLNANKNSDINTYLNSTDSKSITGYKMITKFENGNTNVVEYGGIHYSYDYTYLDMDNNYQTATSSSYVSTSDSSSSLMSMIMGSFAGSQGGTGSSGQATSTEIYSVTSRALAGNELASSIKIYPNDFASKTLVTDYLDKWNDTHSEDADDITYTDSVGLIIGMVNTLIQIITYALIAFTALSLLVSTVMIGIITYVSVVERVKEIGVIRSLGGRKRDVSNLFMAETFIIGLGSGILGIAITYLISLILNLSLKKLIGFNIAALPVEQALLMILVSIALTSISGISPARAAAAKDPVVALRTE